jgi:hypothetical protein
MTVESLRRDGIAKLKEVIQGQEDEIGSLKQTERKFESEKLEQKEVADTR